MDAFVDELDRIRRDVGPAEWTRLIADVVVPHPLLAQLHEEPYTRRAFEKPRGYAGDAVMLDFVYRHGPPMRHAHATWRGTSCMGRPATGERRALWSVERFSPTKSTRWRRDAKRRAFYQLPAATSAKRR